MTGERPRITIYCREWHVHTSGAMNETVITPLAPYIQFEAVAWDALRELPLPQAGDITVFFMLPPPEAWLAQHRNPVIWIPMLDYGKRYPPNLANHPSVRMVAFSPEVAEWGYELGLPVLNLTYFLNPNRFEPARFDEERVLLYWNRTSFFTPSFLARLCKALHIDRLIFRSKTDYIIPKEAHYDLPSRLGDTLVETHDDLTSADGYLDLLRRANVFLAPRGSEGVGIALLEAMASGCMVLGYDAPMMNEYIQHHKTGYLIPRIAHKRRIQFQHKALHGLHLRWRLWVHGQMPNYPFISNFQDWNDIARLDIAQLGKNARDAHVIGYEKWLASIPAYANFILAGN